MSLELCVLASGSAGNCTIVRSPGGVMLIDAGIGPRAIRRRLAGTGVAVEDISTVCLTHLDSDHINANWFPTFAQRDVRVFCHASQVERLRAKVSARGVTIQIEPFDCEAFEPSPGVRFTAMPFAHDEAGSHGFAIEGFGSRAGFATDLGTVPAELIERFSGVDLLAIESNYDPRMQMASPRPSYLKQRIMGGHGHLSNAQAYDAIRRILARCEANALALPRHIVLLHRSRDCNCPDLLRKVFSRDARIAPRLVLAHQDQSTGWLYARRDKPAIGEQLALAFG